MILRFQISPKLKCGDRLLTDLQGSVRAVMNDNGVGTSTVIARHDYLPFGEEIPASIGMRTSTQGYGVTDNNRWNYGMLERDSTTGLDHTWWRKYESTAGRWTSPDPLSGNIGDPQTFNRYAYTHNDPVNFVDTSGLLESWNFCSAQYSFADCGGWSGFWGGNFGGHVAEFNREYGGLSINIAEALRLYNQRVGNARGGFGFLTSAEVLAGGGRATHANWTLCLNGECWGGAVVFSDNSFDWSYVDVDFKIPGAGAGLAAGAGEFSNEAFGYWRGLNNQWIPKSKTNFYGNGSTGSKYAALSRARGFRLFGRAAFAVGALNSGYQYYQGNISGTKAIFDIGFSAAGTFGGPYGFGANIIYSGVDMTIGWPRFLDQEARHPILTTPPPIIFFR